MVFVMNDLTLRLLGLQMNVCEAVRMFVMKIRSVNVMERSLLK